MNDALLLYDVVAWVQGGVVCVADLADDFEKKEANGCLVCGISTSSNDSSNDDGLTFDDEDDFLFKKKLLFPELAEVEADVSFVDVDDVDFDVDVEDAVDDEVELVEQAVSESFEGRFGPEHQESLPSSILFPTVYVIYKGAKKVVGLY